MSTQVIPPITSFQGADLMENGILLKKQPAGELIFLGLQYRPGSGLDKVVPTAPPRVLTRREVNLGHSGVSIFWTPGTDERWVRGYRVSRDEQLLGDVSTSHYYYDHAIGWNERATYAVQTVDGDGNASEWVVAQSLPPEPLTAYALGSHFSEAGRDGWSAKTTDDGQSFIPMKWVAQAKPSGANFGGTPNQVGGVEGYWKGADGTKVGRGWKQAAPSTCSVRTWTAPVAGRVRVVGRAFRDVYRQALGEGLGMRILVNTRQVWRRRR